MILVLHLATHLNFKHCQVRRQETVFNDLLPDNDGVDDFLKYLDIPAQETCSNVPISKSVCQFPVPMITNCQNITINYNIFPRKWLSFMSLHTFLFYCYSCWIDCLLLKFGSCIIFIRPQKFCGRIMVWRSRRRLCTFCFRCLTLVLVSSSKYT
jgi:hypothetical protein